MGENSHTSVAQRAGPIIRLQIQSFGWETDPVGTKWLAKVSGAPEKTTLSWISVSTNSMTRSYK